MKKIFQHVFAVGMIAFLFSLFSMTVFAQKSKTVSTTAQNYVISAKAGGINFIQGNVTVLRKNGKSGYLLKTDTLEIGDKVSTGANGKVEILLNPGSYIRLAGNSEFEFITTSLDDLKLKISRGSAMLEVFADDDFRVIVNTPSAQFYAVKTGVYRVDVLSDGTAKIEVWDGKAQIGDTSASVVKSGREAVVNGNQVAVAKFDKDEKDELEVWSRSRAKELSKINAKLQKDVLHDTLLYSYRTNSWNLYNSFGLWVADASFSGYCFLPFGYGWYSPYGYDLDWNLWRLRMPRYIYNQPPTWINNNPNNNGNNNGGNNQNPPTVRNGRNDRTTTPPFEQIGNGGVTTRKVNPNLIIDDNNPVRFPSNNPSSQPVSQPVPVRQPSGGGGKANRGGVID
jgi:hypothetical protein